MIRCVSLVFFFSALVLVGQCAKILMVVPMPSYSHFSLAFRISKELADRGHQVTSINPYPQKNPIRNYTDVSVAEIVAFVEDFKKKNLFKLNTASFVDNLKIIFDLGNQITEKTLLLQNVQDLLNSGETFDLVIIEHFLNDALVGIASHFQAPVILISPLGASSMTNYIFANPAPSSYVPNVMGSSTKHMNFWERIENFLYDMVSDVLRELIYLPKQREIFKNHFKTDVELDDVLYNVSLMLTNSHVSVNDAIPHVPNIIEIGGFHVNPPKKLPEDLQKFLDESKEGVVLFSMGSNLKSKDLKPEVRNAILKAFSKIKQEVLWKFEEDLPSAPKNLKIMSWVPQQDVLAHPNVQAFITHGGLLSTIETVYHGVPVIGIPVFADQKTNVASAVHNGYAVSIPLSELSEEKLSWALNEILNNPKYRKNVKQRSGVMNDQPLKPIDAAIYWIEHVIRHKGAPHLRAAGLDLKWYQRSMVDVTAFFTSVIIALFVICYILIKKIFGFCLKKKSKITKSKKNE